MLLTVGTRATLFVINNIYSQQLSVALNGAKSTQTALNKGKLAENILLQ